MMSGYAPEDGKPMKVVHLLQKPFEMAALVAEVNVALAETIGE